VGTIRRRENVVCGSLIAHPGISRRPVHAKNYNIACRPEPISSEAERARLAVTTLRCTRLITAGFQARPGGVTHPAPGSVTMSSTEKDTSGFVVYRSYAAQATRSSGMAR
jgi:hypothetical protein